MARSIAVIQKQIQDAAVQYYAAAGITLDPTKWSKRSVLRLWTFIVASVIAVSEQIYDAFQAVIEALIAAAPPGSSLWLQKRAFEFQYSATDPQVLEVVDDDLQYPEIRPDLRIITRCSVQRTLSSKVLIKVAKGTTPGALSAPELSSFIDYMRDRGVAGITYVCTSQDPDKVIIFADIFYRGQYSAVIFDNIQKAINAYYANLPFNGTLKISDLENAIRRAEGVTDVVLKDVKARKDTTLIANATDLVKDNAVIERNWSSVAGYIVEETTAGSTLLDTLNLISE